MHINLRCMMPWLVVCSRHSASDQADQRVISSTPIRGASISHFLYLLYIKPQTAFVLQLKITHRFDIVSQSIHKVATHHFQLVWGIRVNLHLGRCLQDVNVRESG